MKSSQLPLTMVTLLALGTLAACSANSTKSADATDSAKSAEISANIRKSLDDAGLKQVSASHDHGSGMVTLAGEASSEEEKGKAESIAKSMSGGHAVSNHIAVMPMGPGHMGDHGAGGMGGRMGDHGRERKPEPPR